MSAPATFNRYPSAVSFSAKARRLQHRLTVTTHQATLERLLNEAALYVPDPLHLRTSYESAIRVCKRWLEDHPPILESAAAASVELPEAKEM